MKEKYTVINLDAVTLLIDFTMGVDTCAPCPLSHYDEEERRFVCAKWGDIEQEHRGIKFIAVRHASCREAENKAKVALAALAAVESAEEGKK
jgi:hypothetical protein